MNNKYYSSERNVQILLALLKRNGIKKVIVSPGGTNICFVGSIQNDPFFEIYSSVDERSAAYIACGLAAESGEPVVYCFKKLLSGNDRGLLSKTPRLSDNFTYRI